MTWARYALAMSLVVFVLVLPSRTYAQTAPGPFVKQAFDLLMDKFVVAPNSADLLSAGWDGGLAYIKDVSGAEPSSPAPTFSKDPAADWNAFLGAYPQLTAAGGSGFDQHALDVALVSAMAKSLNSTHTFLSARAPIPGQAYGGVGIAMSPELVVTEVFPDGPAEATGMRLGDTLIAVDGAPVEGLRPDEVSAKVRGPVGSSVQFTIRRASQPEPLTLTVVRAEIVVPWVTAQVLEDGIGYLRIRSFSPMTAFGDFDAAVSLLDGADIKGLVIDVRGNPGGYYATSEKVVSRFVREGPIYQRTTRQGQTTTVSVDGSAWGRTIPIAVIVNSGTGSGGELVPSALRENGVGYLVGAHTRGSLAGGQIFPLDDGSSLTIAVDARRSGQGQEIEHVGLEPDQVVDLDLTALAEGHDTQLEAALGYLKGKLGL